MPSFQVGAESSRLSVQFPCFTDSHFHCLVLLPDGWSHMPSPHFGPFSLSFDFFSLPCFLPGHTHFLSLAHALILSHALICSFFLSPLNTFLSAQSVSFPLTLTRYCYTVLASSSVTVRGQMRPSLQSPPARTVSFETGKTLGGEG